MELWFWERVCDITSRIGFLGDVYQRAYDRMWLAGFGIEYAREDDGRWIAEMPDLPGVMVYGRTKREARRLVRALATRVMDERDAVRMEEALAEMKRTGEKPRPWADVRKEMV